MNELLTMTKEELKGAAGKLKLDVPKSMNEDDLRNLVTTESIRQTIVLEEKVRLRLQEESRMKRDIADVQAEARVRGIKIEIPDNPTLTDVITLKKQLNMSIKEPKPSPETLAIEASKKVYAIFHNLEQEDMDIPCNVGGKYNFHLYPERTHILPEWVIKHWQKTASVPIYEKRMIAALESAQVGQTVEASTQTGTKKRFLFEIIGEAPDNSSFGVVLNVETLSSLEQEK